MYGATIVHKLYHEHAQPTLDPAIRVRLRSLINSSKVLRDTLRSRALVQSQAPAPIEPTPSKRVENLDLIRATFGKSLTYNEMGEAAE
jgi:hypothetical protein